MSKEYSEFNCNQEHEFIYIASLYNKPTKKVKEFLKENVNLMKLKIQHIKKYINLLKIMALKENKT